MFTLRVAAKKCLGKGFAGPAHRCHEHKPLGRNWLHLFAPFRGRKHDNLSRKKPCYFGYTPHDTIIKILYADNWSKYILNLLNTYIK